MTNNNEAQNEWRMNERDLNERILAISEAFYPPKLTLALLTTIFIALIARSPALTTLAFVAVTLFGARIIYILITQGIPQPKSKE